MKGSRNGSSVPRVEEKLAHTFIRFEVPSTIGPMVAFWWRERLLLGVLCPDFPVLER